MQLCGCLGGQKVYGKCLEELVDGKQRRDATETSYVNLQARIAFIVLP